jgi:hypothetical protein
MFDHYTSGRIGNYADRQLPLFLALCCCHYVRDVYSFPRGIVHKNHYKNFFYDCKFKPGYNYFSYCSSFIVKFQRFSALHLVIAGRQELCLGTPNNSEPDSQRGSMETGVFLNTEMK